MFEWIENFLRNRLQRVIVNDDKSELKPVTSGIDQRSILGTLFFVIYIINDLPNNIKTNILLFADDITIYTNIRKAEDRELLYKARL